jgi:hypothetical protein
MAPAPEDALRTRLGTSAKPETPAAIPLFAAPSPDIVWRHGARALWMTAEAGQLFLDFDAPSDDAPAGRFFEEMAAIDGAPQSASVVALRIRARREAILREMAPLLRDGVLERTRGTLAIRAPWVLRHALAEAMTT